MKFVNQCGGGLSINIISESTESAETEFSIVLFAVVHSKTMHSTQIGYRLEGANRKTYYAANPMLTHITKSLLKESNGSYYLRFYSTIIM